MRHITGEKFTIAISERVIQDLRRRLRDSRWPVPIGDESITVSRLRSIIDYWQRDFDWEKQQRLLNSLPHFRVNGLHFIHIRSESSDAIPLLLLHGWPGSFVEMLELIPLLRASFHLVIPSLPGYGFSEHPGVAGVNSAYIADRMAELMDTLGYQHFAVQGGDWGAGIATWLALRHTERVIAIHLNYIPGSYQPSVDDEPTAAEQAFLRECETWRERSGGYAHLQRTRPLTLAYGLNDSPVGLAAWILEKFYEWAAPDAPLDLDRLLTNVTLYWVTGTIHSSMRLYLESAALPITQPITTPTAVAHFPHEAPFPPRSWVERGYNLQRWSEMPRDGHFAALEQPELLSADVRAFLSS